MMNEKKLKFYRYEITALSPIHIGTQDFYEPSNYVIAAWSEGGASRTDICPECGGKIYHGECGDCGFMTDETVSKHTTPDKNYLFTFTPADLKDALSSFPGEKDRFLKLSKQNNYKETVKFFVDNAAKIAARGQKKSLVSEKVLQVYKKSSGLLDISKQFCEPISQKPVIPGSSLKGCIRTAILNYYNFYCMEKTGNEIKDLLKREKSAFNANKTIQEKLLKCIDDHNKARIDKDPFKTLKISDTLPAEIETQIIQADSYVKNSENIDDDLTEHLEIIPKGSRFTGTVCLVDDGYLKGQNGVDNNININIVLKSCNEFYGKMWKEEMIQEKNVVVSNFYNYALEENECLIRLGAYSGFECVTIEEYRDYNLYKNGMARKTKAYTMRLSEDKTPFGWAKLKITEVE